MNSLLIAGAIFVCCFGGALLGILLQRLLPAEHLRNESKDVIKLGTGLIATMAALVLGLLIGGAKSSFDSQRSGLQQLATNILMLDRALAHYGPPAQKSRELLRAGVATMMARLWPGDGSSSGGFDDPAITSAGNALYESVKDLKADSDVQRALLSQALQVSADVGKNRWQLSERDDGSLPMPFLFVLAFWLLVLFTSFGVFSPSNETVIAVLFVCALSVAGAVLLIVDLDQPYEGLIQVSSVPLRDALAGLGQ